jgi:hypothetical protein
MRTDGMRIASDRRVWQDFPIMARMQSPLVAGRLARVGPMLCLLAVLLGPSQIAPGLLALGALLEGSHTVRVGMDEAQFHLVLSHERGQTGRPDYAPSHHPQHSTHRHGLAASVLCLLAGRGAMDADHVAVFATGSACEKISQPPAAEAKVVGLEALMPAEFAAATAVVESTSLLPRQNHGPPSGSVLLCLLRSTVLLV